MVQKNIQTIRSKCSLMQWLELSIDDVLKEMNAVNQFETFMDKSHSYFIQSTNSQK